MICHNIYDLFLRLQHNIRHYHQQILLYHYIQVEDYQLYNLLITILSKMVLELDNSDHKLFNYLEDFSWTDLLSDYILRIEEK